MLVGDLVGRMATTFFLASFLASLPLPLLPLPLPPPLHATKQNAKALGATKRAMPHLPTSAKPADVVEGAVGHLGGRGIGTEGMGLPMGVGGGENGEATVQYSCSYR